jgi:hypothetical protein
MSPSWTRLTPIAAAALLLVFAALALTSMRQKSATWDETHYLGVGAWLLHERSWDVPSARLHPPLSFYLNSLTLLADGVDVSEFQRGPAARYGRGIARGRRLLATSEHGAEGLLFRARLPTVVLGVLLGWTVFLWTRDLYGAEGALLSVFLFAFSPNLLAHTRLITPDLAVTAFGFAAFHQLWRGLRAGSRYALGLAGVFLGLALLSKFSALLLLPLVLAVGFAVEAPRVAALRLAAVFALAGGVLTLGYGPHVEEFVHGLQSQLALATSGREPSFLNGAVSNRGWWHYYLVALAIKLPLPLLLLLAARAAMPRRAPGPGWRDTLFLLAPVAAYLGFFSAFGAVNNGLRYVLPILPFLLVWVGRLPAALVWTPPPWRGVGVACLVLACAWTAFGTWRLHPHPLAHFNELVGGPANGHRHLLDSNLDWGQDLPGLAAWQEEKDVAQVALCYFGTADPAQHGVRYRAVPGCSAGPGARPAREIAPGDWVAISATHLQPLFADLGPLAAHYRAREPAARIGYSIHLYRADRAERLGRPGVGPATGELPHP